MTRRTPELGDAELEVLKALWDHEPATVREIRDILQRRGKKVADLLGRGGASEAEAEADAAAVAE